MAAYAANKESLIATLTASTTDTVTLLQTWRAVMIQNLDPTANLFVNCNKPSDPTTDVDGTGDDGTLLIPPGGNATLSATGTATNTIVVKLKGNGNLYTVQGTN